MVSKRVSARSNDADMDTDCRMSEIPFLAEMQRLARKPVAMRFCAGSVRARPVRAGCGMQPQFVAQPPDLCGGDRAVDRLQCDPKAAYRAADGKAAGRAGPVVMVQAEKRHVHLPNAGAKPMPENRTCENRRRISRGLAALSHRHGIKIGNARAGMIKAHPGTPRP
jgi:hypothetical protein